MSNVDAGVIGVIGVICQNASSSQGQKLARWFGPPYNKWYVGTITEVNRRRTKQENVSVEFVDDKYGTTWGHFLASAEDYGADKLWVVLELIPIQLDSDDD